MSAEPVSLHEDPPDPQRILAGLPERERENFLTVYREAMDLARRDPAEWAYLRRVLRAWEHIAVAAKRPGFYEAQEAAMSRTGAGMLLEDYIRQRTGS